MPTSPNSSNTNILGSFTAVLSVISIFLYYTGWIYRWSYFGYFEIEVINLNLSFESFLLVPIQVIAGDLLIFLKFLLASVITIILIKSTLHLTFLGMNINQNLQRGRNFFIVKSLRFLTNLLPQQLINEMLIVIWILVALFWLAKWQGTADAYRDAINETSTKSIITLVSSSEKMALGRNANNTLTNPPLDKTHIFGDVTQFNTVRGQETNKLETTEDPIIWRLLIENNNWVYLFPASSSKKPNERPLVLGIYTGGDGPVQLSIRSRPKSFN